MLNIKILTFNSVYENLKKIWYKTAQNMWGNNVVGERKALTNDWNIIEHKYTKSNCRKKKLNVTKNNWRN